MGRCRKDERRAKLVARDVETVRSGRFGKSIAPDQNHRSDAGPSRCRVSIGAGGECSATCGDRRRLAGGWSCRVRRTIV
ncbi:hypothetical protein KCP69_04645 [Salmonella enterica subsp. enterica]|nr:hypothetical protein KCP69_04645 [Salmonella enterica subsp. enterica]